MSKEITDYFPAETPPGYKQFSHTHRLIREFEQEVEENHMKWLAEILVEAKKTFAQHDTFLLPKTPTVKRKRARRKKNAEEKIVESDEELVLQSTAQRPKLSLDVKSEQQSQEAAVQKTVLGNEKTASQNEVVPSTEEPVLAGNDSVPSAKENIPPKTAVIKPLQNSFKAAEEPRRSTRQRKPTVQHSMWQLSRKRGNTTSVSQEEDVKTKHSTPDQKDTTKEKDENTLKVTDLPPKNSPRQQLESYYKNRVKRLINHHESLIGHDHTSSADEFTPPKRPRLVKAAPSAPSTMKRTTRTRIVKPSVPIPTKARKKEEAKDENDVSNEKEPVVELRPEEEKTVSTVTSEKDASGSHLSDDPNVEHQENETGVMTRSRSHSSSENIPSDETSVRDAKSALAIDGEAVSVNDGAAAPASDGEVSSANDSDAASANNSEAKSDCKEHEEPASDLSSLGSTDSKTPAKDRRSRMSSTTSALRRSSRRSSAIARQSVSKKRSSTYHRFKSRVSIAAVSREAPHSSVITEETWPKEGERRVTRALAKRISEHCSPSETDSHHRRRSDDDDSVLPATSQDNETPPAQKKEGSDSDEPDFVGKTPSPECPSHKIVRPHPRTFLRPSMSKKQSFGLRDKNGQVTSFIKRNTPLKKTTKDRKQEILDKQRREEEIKRKIEDERRLRLEEQKRKREERARKVAEARERKDKIQEEKRMRIEQLAEMKLVMSNKQRDEKRREELEKRQRLTKKKVELEERRKQEEETRIKKIKEQEDQQKRHEDLMQRKREYEEYERQRRMEEAKRQQELRKAELEKKRKEVEIRVQEQKLARERELQQRKEEREREQRELERKRLLEAEQREKERRERELAEEARRQEAEKVLLDKERQEEQRHLKEMMRKERERLDAEKTKENAEHERIRNNVLKQNTSLNTSTNKGALNSTFQKGDSPTSYDMTPQRIYVAQSDTNYGIEDLHSGDSTDDEDAPRKKIPNWAEGAALKSACINQCFHPPDLDHLFPPIMLPDLDKIFSKKRARFFKRTSSAVWDSPPIHKFKF